MSEKLFTSTNHPHFLYKTKLNEKQKVGGQNHIKNNDAFEKPCHELQQDTSIAYPVVKQSIIVNQHHLFEGKEFVSTLWQLNAFLSSFGQWENCKWHHISFTVKHSYALGESVSQNKREVLLVTDVFYYLKQGQTLASGSWFFHAF